MALAVLASSLASLVSPSLGSSPPRVRILCIRSTWLLCSSADNRKRSDHVRLNYNTFLLLHPALLVVETRRYAAESLRPAITARCLVAERSSQRWAGAHHLPRCTAPSDCCIIVSSRCHTVFLLQLLSTPNLVPLPGMGCKVTSLNASSSDACDLNFCSKRSGIPSIKYSINSSSLI